MKTKLIGVILLMLGMIMGGCQKTFYCECSSRGIVQDVTPIKSLGRMGAKSVCDTYQEQNNRNGADQVCYLQ